MKADRREFLKGSLAGLSSFAAGTKVHARAAETTSTEAQIATFVADVTPSVGDPLGLGLSPSVSVIEHPLLAKGVILRDAGGTYVLCSLDWECVCNDAYELFRQRIAEAAGTSPSRVAVQNIQQHTAPGIDSNASQILEKATGAPADRELKLLDAATAKTAAAVHQATGRWRRLTRVGLSWAAVDQVASSRRILQPDGTILARLSSTKDPEQQRAPEGYIDAYLRTISFYDGETPLVNMHYYATHPQSYYGDGRVTYDVPGIARERLEKESGVFQVYFSGCGGDIAMGKYNDGSPARRSVLVGRLYDAMVRSLQKVHVEPLSPMVWRTAEVRFPLRSDPSFSEEANRKVLHDTTSTVDARVKAACNLSMIERVHAGRHFELSCLAMGSIRILHLPGEPFIEFQLWAEMCARTSSWQSPPSGI